MKPYIQNVSLLAVVNGSHTYAGYNAMLIQIVDPDMEFPKPKHQFREIHGFKFLDLEEHEYCVNPDWKIDNNQAAELVRLLGHALEQRMNVVIHCLAGVCRSGAVAEIGVMMGFHDTKTFRTPNLLVKHKMMRCLGMTYEDETEK